MKMICGKCWTEQDMEVRQIGKEQTLYCPNCDDQVSPSSCSTVKTKVSK